MLAAVTEWTHIRRTGRAATQGGTWLQSRGISNARTMLHLPLMLGTSVTKNFNLKNRQGCRFAASIQGRITAVGEKGLP